ncbi:hypothetical protein EDC47_10182 [Raoultella planticola]|nr:hypothetical protein EDC47_10182 [Raoultella planticola]
MPGGASLARAYGKLRTLSVESGVAASWIRAVAPRPAGWRSNHGVNRYRRLPPSIRRGLLGVREWVLPGGASLARAYGKLRTLSVRSGVTASWDRAVAPRPAGWRSNHGANRYRRLPPSIRRGLLGVREWVLPGGASLARAYGKRWTLSVGSGVAASWDRVVAPRPAGWRSNHGVNRYRRLPPSIRRGLLGVRGGCCPAALRLRGPTGSCGCCRSGQA